MGLFSERLEEKGQLVCDNNGIIGDFCQVHISENSIYLFEGNSRWKVVQQYVRFLQFIYL
jgi:hypothetical protein